MNEESIAALALLSRMRFACGDNGLRMQDELEEYLRDLKRDAERYRWLRDRMAVEDMPEEHPTWSTPSEHESAAFDSAVDARMNGANAPAQAPAKAAHDAGN